MKIYRGTRDGQDRVTVTVEQTDPRDPASPVCALRHLVRHSPTGFNWGYGGSGPADLARSILADVFDDPDIAPAIYERFKSQVVAGLGDAWSFDEHFVRAQVVAIGAALQRPTDRGPDASD